MNTIYLSRSIVIILGSIAEATRTNAMSSRAMSNCQLPAVDVGQFYLFPFSGLILSALPSRGHVIHLDRVRLSCPVDDYAIQGHNRSTCFDGRWLPRLGSCLKADESNQQGCNAGNCRQHVDRSKKCQVPTDKNGDFFLKNSVHSHPTALPSLSYVENLTAVVLVCSVDFRVVGPNYSTCLMGNWLPRPGRCIGINSETTLILDLRPKTPSPATFQTPTSSTTTSTTKSTTVTTTTKMPFGNCGVHLASPAVYLGSEAGKGQFPWMVKVYSRYQHEISLMPCSAFIISDEWLLSAAHCFIHQLHPEWKLERVYLMIGRHDLNKSASSENGLHQSLLPENVILHPGFVGRDNYWENDIALIKLNTPLTFRANIQPICLPDPNICQNFTSDTADVIEGCERLLVAGWGQTIPFSEISSKVLHHAVIKVASRQVCMAAYWNMPSSQSQFCARSTVVGTCQGDSGAPGMCLKNQKLYAIGIVSLASPMCGTEAAPSIFSRICPNMRWVALTIYNHSL